ncbi:N-6 DNA methylase [Phaeacidiphilus oryzae]|uniref:N-6 DNA methylase n=1 Tax=Phaeacidiphilus oryzae TaxID=348818 RepID=UPI00055CE2C1|nr:N-6 DNA methylase [Phaeacidiphilus oryzae]
MPEQESIPQVSAAEIARIAGVGRAAVSNWRRRHADFPRPVGGSETSPAFSLTEVDAWLRAHGRLRELPLRDEIRRHLDLLRDAAGSPLVLALAQVLVVQRAPGRWRELAGRPAVELATALPTLAREAAVAALGPQGARGLGLPSLYGSTELSLARLAARLAEEVGPDAAAEELLALPPESAFRQGAVLPAELADLLAELADAAADAGTGSSGAGPSGAGSSGAGRSGGTEAAAPAAPAVADPACGTGALLLAAGRAGAVRLSGAEADPAAAALARLRLAVHEPARADGGQVIDVRQADSLRDGGAGDGRAPLVDAVLSRPPYNDRNWGAEDSAYDPRWEYGLPPRAESELAWAQDALARVRPGGRAVLLLPGAVAARRSGRRIRAELLRRGAVLAVVALPPGLAAPSSVPLHIWVLRRPEPQAAAPERVLLVDAGAPEGAYAAVREAWAAWLRSGSQPVARPGVYRSVPLVDLLDEEVDLTPGRHLPPSVDQALDAVEGLHRKVAEELAGLAPLERLLPAPAPVGGGAGDRARSTVAVAELLRGGGLELLPADAGCRPGDLLVRGEEVRVLGEGEAAPAEATARGCQVLRPAAELLDPWFLAGFLRAAAAAAGSAGTTATLSRRDVRRLRVPRLPLDQQRGYGREFRRIAEFEERLRAAAEGGARLARLLTEGVAEGRLRLP